MASDSASGRIGDGIAALLNGLNLNPRPVSIRSRKRPVLLDGELQQLPLIIVCVGDEEEFEPLGASPERDKRTWAIKRPVTIALAFAIQGKVGDDAALRSWRDAIWNAATLMTLSRTLPELNDVVPRGRAIFDAGAFKDTQVDWSLISLTVETLENRAG